MLSLLPVLLHRIGVILAVTGAVVSVALPRIYPREDDLAFANRLSTILVRLVRVGLLLLALSGFARLQWGLPSALPLKLATAGATLLWAFFRLPSFPEQGYDRSHQIQLALIVTTSLVGIYL